MLLKRLLMLSGTIAMNIAAHNNYAPFVMNRGDIQAVLEQAEVYPAVGKRPCPPDITFGCADIKYDNGMFKVVECGDGIYMSLRAHDVIMNNAQYNLVGPYWGIFWNYLASFGIPVWHIQDKGPANALALDELARLGGRYASSWTSLLKDPVFKKANNQTKNVGNTINSYSGIIVYRAGKEGARDVTSTEYKNFKNKHTNFIYVNANTRDFLKRKDNTYRIFTAAGQEAYIPKSQVFPTVYSPELASVMRSALGNPEKYIIKPVYSSLSIGVNAIASNDLNSFLELILNKKDSIPKQSPRSLSYWRKSTAPHFIASEYASSQTIYKDGKPYDPTMRVMFAMHSDKGEITVNILGGFWKIPVKPLNQAGASLTEKHVTIAHAGDYFSFGMMLDPENTTLLKERMAPVLAKVYEYILVHGLQE